jgi:hypothetical protein
MFGAETRLVYERAQKQIGIQASNYVTVLSALRIIIFRENH